MEKKRRLKKSFIGALLCLIAASALLFYFTYPGFHHEDPDPMKGAPPAASKGITRDAGKSLYKPAGCKFDYKFKKYDDPRAKMTFSVPEKWNVIWRNDRYIEAVAPLDDPYFPGVSFTYIYDFTEGADTESSTEKAQLFKEDLFRHDYQFYGDSYSRAEYEVPEFVTDDSIAKDEKTKLSLACGITRDAKMKRLSSYYHGGDISILDYFFVWHDIPGVITCAVDERQEKDAAELLKVMVSNFAYCDQGITEHGYAEPARRGTGICAYLPAQLRYTETDGSEKVYRAPEDSGTAFSGMAFMQLPLKEEEAYRVSPESIEYELGPKWFAMAACSPQNLIVPMSCRLNGSVKICGMEATRYLCDCTIMVRDLSYDRFYAPGDTWQMEVYRIMDGDSSEVIVFLHQDTQAELAEQVLSDMIEKSKLK